MDSQDTPSISEQDEHNILNEVTDEVPEYFEDEEHLYNKEIKNIFFKRVKCHIFIKKNTDV